jgi:hypothetical protein
MKKETKGFVTPSWHLSLDTEVRAGLSLKGWAEPQELWEETTEGKGYGPSIKNEGRKIEHSYELFQSSINGSTDLCWALVYSSVS